MEMKYVLIGIAILLLVAFFWPKINSKEDDGFTAEIRGDSHFENMACTCIGFVMSQNNCKSCTQYTDCYGIPVSCDYGCQDKINGIWQFTYCSNGSVINQSDNESAIVSPPKDNASCVAQGGLWGPIGLSPENVCVLPTMDAGKACSDSSGCQAACVATLNPNDYNNLVKNHIPVKTTGNCTAWKTSVGCNAYVENGTVNGILCVD